MSFIKSHAPGGSVRLDSQAGGIFKNNNDWFVEKSTGLQQKPTDFDTSETTLITCIAILKQLNNHEIVSRTTVFNLNNKLDVVSQILPENCFPTFGIISYIRNQCTRNIIP
eukprot:TRINITY_DN10421_c0_g1_i10.p1 TRINITY_DN10421_c0_g1~~TRINITY_DN10421_c0_g1_i10.p1  ORF type:complete len:111 (+),score=5.34 TRINITY_DN10421_c0_g1_i10:385-717(+)